ncbi:MAG: hypothetical protein M3R38_21680 [Actinomycetota bacterium]|nr:hypothetical protein [Actinomycetota bacterium]
MRGRQGPRESDPERRSDSPAAFVITGYLTDAIKKGEVLWRPPEEQ